MTTTANPILAAVLLAGLGCTAPIGDSAVAAQADDLIEDIGSGKADGFGAIEVALGDSYAIELAALHAGEPTPANAVVFRFAARAGQSFAIVMRRVDGDAFHAYLSLYDREGRLSESRLSQGLMPMAAEEDGLLIYTARETGEYLLFAADREFEFTGSCQVDFLELAQAPPLDMTATGPGPRAYMEEMRRAEAEITDLHAAGLLEEGADGLLEAHLEATSTLAERADLQRLARAVNSLRQDYFEYVVESALGSGAVGSVAPAVAAFCGQVWRALRAPEHRL